VVEPGGGDLVEVVTVVVGEQHHVERGQLGDGQGRLGQSPGPQAVAELGRLAPVEEVRIGEDREAAVADEHGGGPDEGQRPVVEVAASGPSRQFKREFFRGHGVALTRRPDA